ncbi:hypothetical protein NEOLI_003195 [Neolecta irregularis DAH-3]|uniref:Uncharacterized protein n=1 Tax=Neolecta irregularis (strain DAH-3) TaxID=1198029 RepID=A0A1U7LT03_NEOID|nr:hypothetical protein NEOLI_003195 [Neolecta irregularis DAH-3]|eukprot:OLL25672.1 hypothetical protein NEOLI_003195 [Neolecta irregularis DAH-3]
MPKVLIIGGLSSCARHIALQIHKLGIADRLCIVDKGVPEMQFMDKACEEAILPHFIQGDMSQLSTRSLIWIVGTGFSTCKARFRIIKTIVKVYEQSIWRLSLLPARKAAERGIKCWIQLSSFEVYEASHKRKTENCPTKPCSTRGKWRLKTEESLQNIPGLNLVVARKALSIITTLSLTQGTWLTLGTIFKYQNQELPLLGKATDRQNTVNTVDLARAFIHLAEWYTSRYQTPPTKPLIFNLSDPCDLRQSGMVALYNEAFNVKTRFIMIPNLFAKYMIKSIADEFNETMIKDWSEMLRKAGIAHSPFNPYMDSELLAIREIAMDGSKIEKETGFKYLYPAMTVETGSSPIQDYISRKLWPLVTGKEQVAHISSY